MIDYASAVPCFSHGGLNANVFRLVPEHVLCGVRRFMPRVADGISGSNLQILLFTIFSQFCT